MGLACAPAAALLLLLLVVVVATRQDLVEYYDEDAIPPQYYDDVLSYEQWRYRTELWDDYERGYAGSDGHECWPCAAAGFRAAAKMRKIVTIPLFHTFACPPGKRKDYKKRCRHVLRHRHVLQADDAGDYLARTVSEEDEVLQGPLLLVCCRPRLAWS